MCSHELLSTSPTPMSHESWHPMASSRPGPVMGSFDNVFVESQYNQLNNLITRPGNYTLRH